MADRHDAETGRRVRIQPEPCLNLRCYSVLACSGFGYCRERNGGRAPSPSQIDERRKIAESRNVG